MGFATGHNHWEHVHQCLVTNVSFHMKSGVLVLSLVAVPCECSRWLTNALCLGASAVALLHRLSPQMSCRCASTPFNCACDARTCLELVRGLCCIIHSLLTTCAWHLSHRTRDTRTWSVFWVNLFYSVSTILMWGVVVAVTSLDDPTKLMTIGSAVFFSQLLHVCARGALPAFSPSSRCCWASGTSATTSCGVLFVGPAERFNLRSSDITRGGVFDLFYIICLVSLPHSASQFLFFFLLLRCMDTFRDAFLTWVSGFRGVVGLSMAIMAMTPCPHRHDVPPAGREVPLREERVLLWTRPSGSP